MKGAGGQNCVSFNIGMQLLDSHFNEGVNDGVHALEAEQNCGSVVYVVSFDSNTTT